jgi:hypothetical protein
MGLIHYPGPTPKDCRSAFGRIPFYSIKGFAHQKQVISVLESVLSIAFITSDSFCGRNTPSEKDLEGWVAPVEY